MRPQRLLDELRWAHHPSQAESGESVGLRKGIGHQHPIRPAPERGRFLSRHLGAAVHLVGEDPSPETIGQLHDAIHGIQGQRGSGGIVGIGHENEVRSRLQGGLELVEIGLPTGLLPEVEGQKRGAEVLHHPRNLHVVGEHDRCRAVRLQEVPMSDEVGFRSPHRHQDRGVRGPRVERRDPSPEFVRSVGLAVAQADAFDSFIPSRQMKELRHRQGWTPLSERLMATRFSKVDCHRSILKGVYFTTSSPGSRRWLKGPSSIPGSGILHGGGDPRQTRGVGFPGAHPACRWQELAQLAPLLLQVYLSPSCPSGPRRS